MAATPHGAALSNGAVPQGLKLKGALPETRCNGAARFLWGFTMAKTFGYAAESEAKAARRLIKMILSKGYLISVTDGCSWLALKSTSLRGTLAALYSAPDNCLLLNNNKGERVGWIRTAWRNGPDALVADYSANEATQNIWNEWQTT
jgi:hypothetical protein